MSFDEQCPTATINFKIDESFVKCPLVSVCGHCGMPTAWFHRPLALHLCSRECYERYVARRLRRRSDQHRLAHQPCSVLP